MLTYAVKLWADAYEDGLKSSYAGYDAMVEFDKMWFIFLT